MTHDLQVLQAARLKGRPTDADLAAAVGIAPAEAPAMLESLIEAGELDRAGVRLRLSAAGRARLDELLARERAEVDQAQLQKRYEEFDEVNRIFKQLVTDWQLVDGVRPNDHSDSDYDAHIMQRLVKLHEHFQPLLAQFIQLAPRLAQYESRFGAALEKVGAGDHRWFAQPLIDSYHTVWFELHEDLIGLAGLSRVEEAAAGRAE